MRLLPWLAVLALPFSAVAHEKSLEAPAAEDGPAAASRIFDRLQDLYETGSTPVYAACGRYGYAGRCFSRHRDSAVKGAGYVIDVSTSDNGPIDPHRLDYATVSVWSDDLDEFDRKRVSEVAAEGNWHRAFATRHGLRTRLATVHSTLRDSGDYLIERIADLDGRVLNYCYYFKSLGL